MFMIVLDSKLNQVIIYILYNTMCCYVLNIVKAFSGHQNSTFYVKLDISYSGR